MTSTPFPVTHLDGIARGSFKPDTCEITLISGSILTIDLARIPPSNIAGNYRKVRSHVQNGDIRPLPDGTFEVVRDIPDLSPSAARVFADGKVGSGWYAWVLPNGQLLDSLRPRGAKPVTQVRRPTSVPRLVRSGVPPPPVVGPPQVTPPHFSNRNPTSQDIVRALVAWIQSDPYQPPMGRPVVQGWDQRITTYAYATRWNPPAWHLVNAATTRLINGLSAIVAAYKWKQVNTWTDLATADYNTLLALADQVRKWGGVRRPRGHLDAWKVIKSAVLNARHNDAPMNSGWTKLASFATQGLRNAQTIWDSRVSTSLIWRMDRLLHANGLTPAAILSAYDLGLVAGRTNAPGKPRARTYLLAGWPNGYGKWSSHLAGSELVRDIVTILNAPNPGYSPMPHPGGGTGPWDVFGVGLVLFMDGY